MEVPSCLFPVELRAESTNTNSADLAWTAGANEDSWELIYSVAPLDLTTTPIPVDTTAASLNGLTINTHYQAAVRAKCDSISHSAWSEVIDFWTTTTPATFPYTQTFEDNDADRENWVLVNGDQHNFFMYGNINTSTTGKGLIITNDSTSNSYIKGYYTPEGSNDPISYTYYSTVWAYRDIQFPETDKPAFMVKMDWKCNGEVDYDFGEMFIGNATTVTNFDRNINHPGSVEVNTTHYVPAGLTKLGRFVDESTIQHNAAFLIPAELVAGKVQRLYILWTNDSLSGNENPLGLDNINITIPEFSNMTGTVIDAETQNPIAGATLNFVAHN
jgi:hypothetical protein